jgi:hypothetical protein
MINKTQRNFSLLAVALVLALAFTAQSAFSAPLKSKSPFEGRWRFIIPGYGYTDMIFTGNEWVQTVDAVNHQKGTFTYTATQITMTKTHVWDGKRWTAKSESDEEPTAYTLSGNPLTLPIDGEAMAFVKQP